MSAIDERCELCSFYYSEDDEEPCKTCIKLTGEGHTDENGNPIFFEIDEEIE